MKRRFIYDADLDAIVEITRTNRPDDTPSGMQIIRDIEPYRTVAADVASNGEQVVIGSRSRHRVFLRDNGYSEVGNERPVYGERPTLSREERIQDIRRAMGDFR